MGADLNYVKNKKKKFLAMSDVDGGYYRDCYNSFGTFAGLGLSWWQDVIPMLDKGVLSVEKAEELKKMVEDKLSYFEMRAKPDMQIYQEVYAKNIIEDSKILIAFLDNAIKLGIKIDCSL